jgi:hypothetical protein
MDLAGLIYKPTCTGTVAINGAQEKGDQSTAIAGTSGRDNLVFCIAASLLTSPKLLLSAKIKQLFI